MSVYTPTLTYCHDIWLMIERRRSWKEAAEKSFLCMMIPCGVRASEGMWGHCSSTVRGVSWGGSCIVPHASLGSYIQYFTPKAGLMVPQRWRLGCPGNVYGSGKSGRLPLEGPVLKYVNKSEKKDISNYIESILVMCHFIQCNTIILSDSSLLTVGNFKIVLMCCIRS